MIPVLLCCGNITRSRIQASPTADCTYVYVQYVSKAVCTWLGLYWWYSKKAPSQGRVLYFHRTTTTPNLLAYNISMREGLHQTTPQLPSTAWQPDKTGSDFLRWGLLVQYRYRSFLSAWCGGAGWPAIADSNNKKKRPHTYTFDLSLLLVASSYNSRVEA